MSESKYQPPVNMPEKVPGSDINPGNLLIQFLHSSGQWVGTTGDQLMLKQVEPNVIGLGSPIENGAKFRSFVLFPGTLTTVPVEEKKVVIP